MDTFDYLQAILDEIKGLRADQREHWAKQDAADDEYSKALADWRKHIAEWRAM